MSFRFRLGPFTFGRTGTRLSLWGRGIGFSAPLSGKGRSFGKIGLGPFSWFFTESPSTARDGPSGEGKVNNEVSVLGSYEMTAIKAFGSDRQFLEKLRRNGVPWRGVQERLKEELPNLLSDRDTIAYALVPKAMDATFGQQDAEWKTEKRLSKGGSGYTTWIIASRSRRLSR